MIKQFELNIASGTYISTNGVAGANTGFSYFRRDRGLALKGTSGDDITFSQTLTGVKTILFGIKKTNDTTVIKDDVTTKIEISSGDISGTGLSQCYIDNLDTDTVGIGYKLVIAEFSAGIDFSTNIKIAPSSDIYLAHKIVFYDSLLSSQERANELNSFIHASPKITERYPRFMPEMKSSDTSKEIGIATSFNFIRTGNVWVDTSGEGFNITINKGISTLSGAKLKAAETIGNIGNIKSISFRIKPDSTTEKLMEGAANDKLIHINAGTLTYPEFDLAYVNGAIGTAMVADQWQNVVITSSINVDFSACSLALNDTTTGNFEIANLRFFIDEKSANWAVQYHNQFAKRIALRETLDYAPIGSKMPNEVSIESGTFSIAEDSTSKYINCDGNGTINYSGIDLSKHSGNGWVEKLEGDLSGDESGTVDDATALSFASNKLSVAMTTGQKLRNIIIIQSVKYKPLSPNNISAELKFHLDGKDSSKFTLNGTKVIQWDCKGILAAHVSNAIDAQRPTYDINTGRITFIAVNNTFLQSAAFGSALTQPNTVFVVYKITGNTGDNQSFLDGRDATNRHLFRYDNTNDKFDIFAGSLSPGIVANTNDNIHVGLFNGASSNYWINGILEVSSADIGTQSLAGITLGATYNFGSHANCEIREVIGYNAILPFHENYGIFLGLKDKWLI